MAELKKIFMVIPCFNEEEVLPETSKRLLEKYEFLIENKKISEDSKIVFVDDGSRDKTWQIISDLHEKNDIFSGVKLSRNHGHQGALLAGLMTVKDKCDAAISMDADLQDDINTIDKFVEKFDEGCEIVYGVRSSRKKDTFFKRFTAQAFYKLMLFLGVEIIYNHADFRLMSSRAIEVLSQFKEVNLFLRGIVPLVGFKTDTVTYERNERFAGESKYPLKKMISFAVNGITSFSIKPIRMVFAVGVIIFICSIIMLIYSFIVWLCGKTVAGWTTLVISIWALGGIQLLSLGMIGEYIGKIYKEVKARPLYIIEEVIL
ncbi:MAG: glycosyltransferase family 2 protein [Oscillospiraceae bacterium]|nr:glycosyltransferase family 2 protein [Oscillospiraceae bacterium]